MRVFVRHLNNQYLKLYESSCALVRLVPEGKLYSQPCESDRLTPVYSCGEHILRSAAAIEQIAGGTTANLWDDPFEWTLPESLPTNESVLGHLAEVERARADAFAVIAADDDLAKEIMTPGGERATLGEVWLGALVRAAHHQGRAFATFRLFSAARLPHL